MPEQLPCVIADGPFDATFTADNLSRTYGGRTHLLSRLNQETALRAAEEAEVGV